MENDNCFHESAAACILCDSACVHVMMHCRTINNVYRNNILFSNEVVMETKQTHVQQKWEYEFKDLNIWAHWLQIEKD